MLLMLEKACNLLQRVEASDAVPYDLLQFSCNTIDFSIKIVYNRCTTARAGWRAQGAQRGSFRAVRARGGRIKDYYNRIRGKPAGGAGDE
jgi:hypothetical protein